MSRIGKLPISIPAGVTVTLKDNVVTVKGPKGEMSQYVNPAINVAIEDGHVTLTENDKEMLDNPKQKHAFHGLYRSLVHNMVVGVSEGYKKELELVGVGYRASNQGNIIELALGYTHNIFIQLPAEVKVETKSERNKNPLGQDLGRQAGPRYQVDRRRVPDPDHDSPDPAGPHCLIAP